MARYASDPQVVPAEAFPAKHDAWYAGTHSEARLAFRPAISVRHSRHRAVVCGRDLLRLGDGWYPWGMERKLDR